MKRTPSHVPVRYQAVQKPNQAYFSTVIDVNEAIAEIRGGVPKKIL